MYQSNSFSQHHLDTGETSAISKTGFLSHIGKGKYAYRRLEPLCGTPVYNILVSTYYHIADVNTKDLIATHRGCILVKCVIPKDTKNIYQ